MGGGEYHASPKNKEKLLDSEAFEGCSKLGISEVIGVVKSSLSVHAWSLVIIVTSVVIATIVVIVVLLLPLTVYPFDAP